MLELVEDAVLEVEELVVDDEVVEDDDDNDEVGVDEAVVVGEVSVFEPVVVVASVCTASGAVKVISSVDSGETAVVVTCPDSPVAADSSRGRLRSTAAFPPLGMESANAN